MTTEAGDRKVSGELVKGDAVSGVGTLRLELASSVDAGGSENPPRYCIEKWSGVCCQSNPRPKLKFLVSAVGGSQE